MKNKYQKHLPFNNLLLKICKCLYIKLTNFMGAMSIAQSWCSVEANSPHRANGAVLAAPVREVVVITLLQDVVGSSVVGLLIHRPPVYTEEG